ncbi:hypothetical protein [Geothermobacter ehrlichii]|uniref:hypothetical protein n=1 Tax=Geothermobacter ehrlichii TaxID=213224 RepID=UPI001652E36B|nr:hypothetical protein [Geothermobacter ehrlichii]
MDYVRTAGPLIFDFQFPRSRDRIAGHQVTVVGIGPVVFSIKGLSGAVGHGFPTSLSCRLIGKSLGDIKPIGGKTVSSAIGSGFNTSAIANDYHQRQNGHKGQVCKSEHPCTPPDSILHSRPHLFIIDFINSSAIHFSIVPA